MRSVFLAFCLSGFLACAGCDRAPASAPIEHAKAFVPASLGLDEVDASDFVATLGAPFAEPVDEISSEDDFTAGRSKVAHFEGASSSIYMLPDGQVWQVRLGSGIGEQCGQASTGDRLADALARKFAGPDADRVAAALKKGLRDGRGEQLEVNGHRFSASGGCVDLLAVRVAGDVGA